MENQDQLASLTASERASYQEPALRQRALAVAAAAEFATKTGMTSKEQSTMLEHVRGLDKGEAKKARLVLEQVSELLEASGVDVIMVETAEKNKSQAAELKQRRSRGRGKGRKSSQSTTTRKRSVKKGESRSASGWDDSQKANQELVSDSLERLITEEGPDNGLNIDRVEAFLAALQEQGVVLNLTAADVTHNTIEQLARIYATNTDGRITKDAIRINSMITWGYLAGISGKELTVWRAATKPGANPTDVSNSRRSFVGGLAGAWRETIKSGIDPHELVIQASVESNSIAGESGETEDEEDGFVELPQGQKHEPGVSSAELAIPDGDVAMPAPGQVEKEESAASQESYDEEPAHIRIAHEYITRLGLDVNRRALEEFFNPKSRGELTSSKLQAIESIAKLIDNFDGDVFEGLDLDSQGKAALRRMFGTGFVKGAASVPRTPVPLQEQLKPLENSRHQKYIQNAQTGLDVLLDALAPQNQAAEVEPTPEPEQDSAEVVTRRPLQVQFSESGASLSRL